MEKFLNKIIQGDALEVLKTLPNESIDCIITSPPYYGLRDYRTAEWEGGDGGCDHIERLGRNDTTPERLAERAKLYGSGTGSGSKVNAIQFTDICVKCGAKRIDQQLGLEKTFDEFLKKILEITAELKRVLKPTGQFWLNFGDCYGTGSGSGSRKGTKQATNTGSNYYEESGKEAPGEAKCLMMMPERIAIGMLEQDGGNTMRLRSDLSQKDKIYVLTELAKHKLL